MKLIFILLFSSSVLLTSSCNEETPKFDFCGALARHGQNVNYDSSSPTYLEDRKIRYSIFRTTFDDFMEYADKVEFPERRNPIHVDSCNVSFVISHMFVHMIQSDPDYFLDEKVISRIKKHYIEGAVDQRLLLITFYAFLHNQEICDSTLIRSVEVMKEFDLYDNEYQNETLSALVDKVNPVKCN